MLTRTYVYIMDVLSVTWSPAKESCELTEPLLLLTLSMVAEAFHLYPGPTLEAMLRNKYGRKCNGH